MFKFITATVLALTLGLGSVANAQIFGRNTGLGPIYEVAVTLMVDGSADGDVTQNQFSPSRTMVIPGSGEIRKVCMVASLGAIIAEAGILYLFDTDPVMIAGVADMTLAEANTVVAMFTFDAAGYNALAATAVNCQDTNEVYHNVTHAVYFQLGATTFATEDIAVHIWYQRRR